jgi:hypothetical protein
MMPRGTSARVEIDDPAAEEAAEDRRQRRRRLDGDAVRALRYLEARHRDAAVRPERRIEDVACELCEVAAALVEGVAARGQGGAVDRRLEIGLHPRAARVLDRGAGDDEERHQRHREQDRDRAAPVAGKGPEHGASLFHDSPS